MGKGANPPRIQTAVELETSTFTTAPSRKYLPAIFANTPPTPDTSALRKTDKEGAGGETQKRNQVQNYRHPHSIKRPNSTPAQPLRKSARYQLRPHGLGYHHTALLTEGKVYRTSALQLGTFI